MSVIGEVLGDVVKPAVSAGVEVGKTAANLTADQLNQQDFRKSAQSTQKTFDKQIHEAAKSETQGVRKEAETAKKAVQSIGKTEEEELGKISEVTKTQSEMLTQQAEMRYQELQQATQNINDISTDILNNLGALTEKASIDPKRFLKEPGEDGTFQPSASKESAAALGLFLGGWGAGITGGPNFAQDFLLKQQERDIAAQQQTYENKMKAIVQTSDLLKDNINLMNIRTTANQMATLTVLAGQEAQIKAMLTGLQSKTAQDKAKMLLQDIQTRAAQILQNFDLGIAGEVQAGNSTKVNAFGNMLYNMNDKQVDNAMKKTGVIFGKSIGAGKAAIGEAQQQLGIGDSAPAPAPSPQKGTPSIFEGLSNVINKLDNFRDSETKRINENVRMKRETEAKAKQDLAEKLKKR